MQKLRLIERMIKGAQEVGSIVQPYRRLVRHETMVIASEKRHLWLFTDLLIATKQLDRAGLSFEFKYQLELAECKVLKLPETHKLTGKGFLIEYPTRCYLAQPAANLVGDWITALNNSIRRHQFGVFGAPLQRIIERERERVPQLCSATRTFLSKTRFTVADIAKALAKQNSFEVQQIEIEVNTNGLVPLHFETKSPALLLALFFRFFARLPDPLLLHSTLVKPDAQIDASSMLMPLSPASRALLACFFEVISAAISPEFKALNEPAQVNVLGLLCSHLIFSHANSRIGTCLALNVAVRAFHLLLVYFCRPLARFVSSAPLPASPSTPSASSSSTAVPALGSIRKPIPRPPPKPPAGRSQSQDVPFQPSSEPAPSPPAMQIDVKVPLKPPAPEEPGTSPRSRKPPTHAPPKKSLPPRPPGST